MTQGTTLMTLTCLLTYMSVLERWTQDFKQVMGFLAGNLLYGVCINCFDTDNGICRFSSVFLLHAHSQDPQLLTVVQLSSMLLCLYLRASSMSESMFIVPDPWMKIWQVYQQQDNLKWILHRSVHVVTLTLLALLWNAICTKTCHLALRDILVNNVHYYMKTSRLSSLHNQSIINIYSGTF